MWKEKGTSFRPCNEYIMCHSSVTLLTTNSLSPCG
jgi:hypothetical protein